MSALSGEAYPLYWPEGRPRTTSLEDGSFKVSLATARDHIVRQLHLMEALPFVISSNIPLRRDGLPRANAYLSDHGVAVYFLRKGIENVIACDRYTFAAHNMRAIGLTLEALRGIARWGTSEMVEAAYRGYQALPGPAPEKPVRPWHEVIGCPRDAELYVIEAVVNAKRKRLHPDKETGDREAFEELNAAWQRARASRGAS